MWSRRRFLEAVSTVPVIGNVAALVGAGAVRAEASTVMGAPDYFRDLGVRPFINASGTYTAMTASLMPPEVMEAINYASKQYVMLEELQVKVGERIATLVHAEAAMVTSGAASALTLGTAAVLTGSDQKKMVDFPDLTNMKSEVIIQKSHRFGYDHAVRNCGLRLVEVETREDLERAVNPKTAMMLFYNNNNKEGRIQDEEFVQLGKKHSVPTFNDAAADVPPVENLWKYTKMGFDLVTFSGGRAFAARRVPDCCSGARIHRRGSIERASERQHRRPRHEGQQGRDRRHAGGAGALPQEGTRARAGGLREARRDDPQQRGSGVGVKAKVHARGRQPCAPRPRDLGQQQDRDARRGGHGDARRRAVDRHTLRGTGARHRRVDDATRRRQGRRQASPSSARGEGLTRIERCHGGCVSARCRWQSGCC